MQKADAKANRNLYGEIEEETGDTLASVKRYWFKKALKEDKEKHEAYPEAYWIDENNHDAVNHPSHYCIDGIECIDVIKATTKGMPAFDAFCQGNAMKYLFRWQYKNGVEDLKKARWYIDKLIERWDGEINNEKK